MRPWQVPCIALMLLQLLSYRTVQTRHLRVQSESKDGEEQTKLQDHIGFALKTPPKRFKAPDTYDHGRGKNQEVHTVKLQYGLCTDEHPMCPSYALNGLCDWPGLFQDLDKTHKTCAFSCGNCKESIPLGEAEMVGDGWDNISKRG